MNTPLNEELDFAARAQRRNQRRKELTDRQQRLRERVGTAKGLRRSLIEGQLELVTKQLEILDIRDDNDKYRQKLVELGAN